MDAYKADALELELRKAAGRRERGAEAGATRRANLLAPLGLRLRARLETASEASPREWTPHHLSSRLRRPIAPFRVVKGLAFEHGAGDAQQPIGNGPQCPRMAVTAAA